MTERTRILAVDPGAMRIGLAICDKERRIASPLATYERRDAEQDARYFQTLVQEEGVGLLLVGLPMHTDGREGVSAAAARTLGEWLGKQTGLPVVYWDERFTTQFAESALWQAGLTHKQRKARRDQVAAQMVLEAYLEAGCPQEETKSP